MSTSIETEVLSKLASELSAEGYDVYRHPQRALLPSFFGDYRPDLIARKEDHNLAVELKRRSSQVEPKLSQLSDLFRGHADWEFRVVWLDDATERSLPAEDATTIGARLTELRRLADADHPAATIVFGWSIFEAIGRATSPRHLARPQTPARLVGVLAGNGDLTPTEADKLRELAQLRNLLVHGSLSETVSREQINEFIAILEKLHRNLAPEYA